MKIAVTYDNGKIYSHFGKCENFIIYTVDNGDITDSEVISVDVSGHDALAKMLATKDVSVLICGGIGSGAQFALRDLGIDIYAGAEGSTDSAVEAFLRGELVDAGITCGHHDDFDDSDEGFDTDSDGGCGSDGGFADGCGCNSDSGCGSGCGSAGGCGSGCGGCGGGYKPPFDGKNVGKTVRAHYCGTFDNGEQFDSSYDRGEPLEFVCGAGMMIPGFDKAVANMEVGEIIDVHLMPEEAYGPKDPMAIVEVVLADLPGAEELEVGARVALGSPMGPVPVTVTAKTETTITFDANHEMAGKELNFRIELVEVK
ncbi:MAG: FKBP-type peptidyl-prolyl cis-trans isomerase [Lachnospiraceae bacterium]|nr:FKBP-type peptidyl-prolyl cis-trans isomerase [Lachnospiraceae bacterium]